MRRLLVCLVLLPFVLRAAMIRGNVVENQSGKPLARALVTLEPVAGTGSTGPINLSRRTNAYGAFEFVYVPAGAYVVKASRRGFRSAQYGQKRWNAAGKPVAVASDASVFVTIRLPRYGGITGTVVDENDVGVAQQPVVAYRATQPPELVGRSTADERGVYRIGGLDPGTYLVRTAGSRDDDIAYLPTFSKETLRVEEGRVADVRLDEDERYVDVRPIAGILFTISGAVITTPPGVPVSITLASDTGRQTVPGPTFEFQSLPPGQYELYAEAPENPVLHSRFQAAYMPLRIDRNMTGLALQLQPVRETRFDISPTMPPNSMQLLVRRKDLAGLLPTQSVTLASTGALLAPGRWELSLVPPADYYVSGFFGSGAPASGRGRPDGWNEVAVGSFGALKVSLSPGSGGLHGLAKASGDAVPGVPVYLEAYDPDTRKRLTDLHSTRTDLRGMYHFDGLAPGVYRVLATFEYDMPDVAAMDLAGARLIQIDARSDVQMDLDLYGER